MKTLCIALICLFCFTASPASACQDCELVDGAYICVSAWVYGFCNCAETVRRVNGIPTFSYCRTWTDCYLFGWCPDPNGGGPPPVVREGGRGGQAPQIEIVDGALPQVKIAAGVLLTEDEEAALIALKDAGIGARILLKSGFSGMSGAIDGKIVYGVFAPDNFSRVFIAESADGELSEIAASQCDAARKGNLAERLYLACASEGLRPNHRTGDKPKN